MSYPAGTGARSGPVRDTAAVSFAFRFYDKSDTQSDKISKPEIRNHLSLDPVGLMNWGIVFGARVGFWE